MNKKLNIIIMVLSIMLIISMLILLYSQPNMINRYIPLKINTKSLYLKDNHSLSFNDYHEYYFSEKQDSFFENNNYYGKVKAENFDKYKSYFADIIGYFKYNNNEKLKYITYNDNIITENDYVYIDTLEGKKNKKRKSLWKVWLLHILLLWHWFAHIVLHWKNIKIKRI